MEKRFIYTRLAKQKAISEIDKYFKVSLKKKPVVKKKKDVGKENKSCPVSSKRKKPSSDTLEKSELMQRDVSTPSTDSGFGEGRLPKLIEKKNTKSQSDSGFDALQTDDSTDYESDSENKPAVYWSLYRNRIAIVKDQAAFDTKIVDALFGAKWETVDSLDIFPAAPQVKRRRSTAVWKTPPRYSMLPKY